MSSQRTILLSNFYNEEYLLPFWLNHHKNMFDHGILLDYSSTDRSVAICKEICPTWEIITTTNPYFGAEDIDKEFMKMEEKIEGIKIILNTTELLFCEKPIKELFAPYKDTPHVLRVLAYSPYSLIDYYPQTNKELYKNLLNDEFRYQTDRGYRFMHNHTHGNYSIGRHTSHHKYTESYDMHIIWLGYYPFNEITLKRKMQFKSRIPEKDIIRCFGMQHLYSAERIHEIRNEFHASGSILEDINPSLCRQIENMCKD